MTIPSGEQAAQVRPELRPDQQAATTAVIESDAQATIAKTAADGIEGDPRRALILIRDQISESMRRGKSTKGLESQIKVLKESKDPKDRALAIDFEIAQNQYELVRIDRTIALYQSELGKSDLAPEAKAQYESAVKQLQIERDGLQDTATGEIKQKGLAQTVVELKAERQKIQGDIPNSFKESATMFGASSEQAELNPLGVVVEKLQSVKGDKKNDPAFFKQLDEKGVPKDAQNVIADILRVMRGEKTAARRTGEFVGKASLFATVLGLIMAWMASKQGRAQAMG